MPFNLTVQYAHCVGEFIVYSECDKPRVLHAVMKLNFQDIQHLKLKLEMTLATCGSWLEDLNSDEAEDSEVSRVFVRVNLSCSDPVEIAYYYCRLTVDTALCT